METPELKKMKKQRRPLQKGYTLVELMVVLAIIMALSTFGVFVYQRAIAYAKETVCKTNLKALSDAVRFYLKDQDVFPASLGQLNLEHFQKGHAKAREEGGWIVGLSYFVLRMDAAGQAHAQFLTYENLKEYGAVENTFACPAGKDKGYSYGINGTLAGKPWSEIPADAIIVGDCDSPVFYSLEDLSERHRNKALAIAVDGAIGIVADGTVTKWDRVKDLVVEKTGKIPPGLQNK